jgi:hypothetical protein
MNTTDDNNKRILRSWRFANEEKDISFETLVDYDEHGVVEVNVRVKNKSYFGRKKVQVLVQFLSGADLILELKSMVFNLGGAVSRSKRTQTDSFGWSLPLDSVQLSTETLQSISTTLKEFDSAVTNAAANLRKLRVLYDGSSEQVVDATKQLQDLKSKRAQMATNLDEYARLDAITINIVNNIS